MFTLKSISSGVASELNTSDVFVVEANNASAQPIDAKDHTLVQQEVIKGVALDVLVGQKIELSTKKFRHKIFE